MAKRLSENLTSLYVGASNKLKSKDARQKIVAYVESYADISFWRMVLDEFEDETRYFEVMLPSRNSLGKGKKLALMNQLGPQLGNCMIACVDADYDYLLQNTTPTSRMINSHPYVFHTYAYAIENYLCYAENLHKSCVVATLNDRQLVDFEGFMKEYSLIIWPLFVWSVWMYRNDRYREFTLTDFCCHVSFQDINVFHPENTLDFVKRKVNRKIASLQHHYPEAKRDYESLKKEIITLGVTPETTYLYIQGHTLFDHVVLPLLTPVCVMLRKERDREIQSFADHDTQRQNEWACYLHSQTPLEDTLRNNLDFKDAPPYAYLRRDLQVFINGLKQSISREELI